MNFFISEFSSKIKTNNMGAKKINNDVLVDALLILLGKEIEKGISRITGSGITLTNNEIKGIMKVIKSLENRGILLKGTTTKTTSQEGGFSNFLRPLMTDGLSLMKSVLATLYKSVLIPLALSVGMSAADENLWIRIY